MSLEVCLTLICDGCGQRVDAPNTNRAGNVNSSLWSLRRTVEGQGWTTINRGRGHTNTHWCKECSSKPMRPVPNKNRRRKASNN